MKYNNATKYLSNEPDGGTGEQVGRGGEVMDQLVELAWKPIETASRRNRLLVFAEGEIYSAEWKLGYWCIAGTAFPLLKVTHWMPLPAPPKE